MNSFWQPQWSNLCGDLGYFKQKNPNPTKTNPKTEKGPPEQLSGWTLAPGGLVSHQHTPAQTYLVLLFCQSWQRPRQSFASPFVCCGRASALLSVWWQTSGPLLLFYLNCRDLKETRSWPGILPWLGLYKCRKPRWVLFFLNLLLSSLGVLLVKQSRSALQTGRGMRTSGRRCNLEY